MSLRLRSKIPLLMVGVVVSLVILILFAVSSIVNRSTAVTLQDDLREARLAFEEFQQLRIRETRLVASLPFFKATLRTKDPPTILLLIKDLQKKIGNDLFIITDEQGIILARTDGVKREEQPFSHSVVQAALEKQVTTGLLIEDEGVYQISGIPVVFRKRVFGTVIVGFLINDAICIISAQLPRARPVLS